LTHGRYGPKEFAIVLFRRFAWESNGMEIPGYIDGDGRLRARVVWSGEIEYVRVDGISWHLRPRP
jgi:hypothetical protein